MKQLPKYGFLTNSVGFDGMKVILLEQPYLIASIFEVSQNIPEKIEEFMEDKIQGRCPVGKVKGYSIFLKMFTSLEPNNNFDYQQAILDEMADFVLTERVQKKLGQFKGCNESGKTLKEIVAERDAQVRLRERRKKPNE